jgi:hypothetical protein
MTALARTPVLPSLRVNGANRKPAFLLRFRQGASQPVFQQSYAFTVPCGGLILRLHQNVIAEQQRVMISRNSRKQAYGRQQR